MKDMQVALGAAVLGIIVGLITGLVLYGYYETSCVNVPLLAKAGPFFVLLLLLGVCAFLEYRFVFHKLYLAGIFLVAEYIPVVLLFYVITQAAWCLSS